MMRPSTVPQREIAGRLGITQAAVSMALSGSSRISEATRARVQALADELGYTRLPRRRRTLPRSQLVALPAVLAFEPAGQRRMSWTA